MSVRQLECRIISLLEKHDGFIEAQNVLEGHFAALLKVKSKKNSKSHHLRQVKSLLRKMDRQGKIVIGWSGRNMRTATLVKQEVVLPMSELNEPKCEEVHVQEVVASQPEETDSQPTMEPEVSADQAAKMPKHELLTLALLEGRKIGDEDGLVRGPIISLLQDGLGCSRNEADQLVKALKDLGLIETVTRGRKPVYRMDKKVPEVTQEMYVARSTPTSAAVGPSSKSKPKTGRAKPEAKAKAAAPSVEGGKADVAPVISATQRLEKILNDAATEIKRLREQDARREQELQALRAENKRLKDDLDVIGATGNHLEEILQLDLVH